MADSLGLDPHAGRSAEPADHKERMANPEIDPGRIDKLVTIAIPHPIALFMHPEVAFAPHFMELIAPRAEDMVRRDDFRYLDDLIARWSPTWDVPSGTTESMKNAFTAPGLPGTSYNSRPARRSPPSCSRS